MKEDFFNLYGMRFLISGDLDKARDRAMLANKLMFQTKMQNTGSLDIIQGNLRLADGTTVNVMSQHGLDTARIYVPVVGVEEKKYIESQKTQILPYIFASENSFTQGGLLVCHNGLDLSGGYELFSPYGEESEYPEWKYQPFEYNDNQIEWQVKNFYDSTRLITDEETGTRNPIFWNEFKWMDSGALRIWDPTFYETYAPYDERADKPYAFVLTKTLVDNSAVSEENPTGEYDWSWMYEIDLDGQIIWTGEDRTWARTTPSSPTGIMWYREGPITTNIGTRQCLDQTDHTKHVLILAVTDFYAETDTYANLEAATDYTYSIKFIGLGHDQEIPGYTGGLTDSYQVLYNIGDTYICLFSMWSETGLKLIGSAVEGGDFNAVDVSSGINFGGEDRNLFTGDRAISLGMILRQEPKKVEEVI